MPGPRRKASHPGVSLVRSESSTLLRPLQSQCEDYGIESHRPCRNRRTRKSANLQRELQNLGVRNSDLLNSFSCPHSPALILLSFHTMMTGECGQENGFCNCLCTQVIFAEMRHLHWAAKAMISRDTLVASTKDVLLSSRATVTRYTGELKSCFHSKPDVHTPTTNGFRRCAI